MNYEQLDNNENIISLLEKDDILRNKYLLSFLKIMQNNGRNRLFSLNGRWGSGKTIFIRKLDILIKFFYMYKGKSLCWENIYSDYDKFNDANIERLNSLLTNDSYKQFNDIVKKQLINCVYFNAWEHDDEEDPIISILFSLIKKYNLFDETQKKKLTSILNTVNILIKNVSFGALDFQGLIESQDLYESVNRKEQIKEAVNSLI